MNDDFPATDGPVCIVGSLNADLVVRTQRHPRPGETLRGGPLQISPGGKSANQAVAAARLGARVTMVGAVGDDAHGELLLRSLTGQGVDVEHVRVLDATATGTAVITVSDDGENTIVISAGANGELSPQDLPQRVLDGAGALALTFEVPPETVLAAARAGRAAGVPVVLNPSPFRTPEPELLGCTDLLVINSHEMGQLLDDDTTDFSSVRACDWDVQGRRLHDVTGVRAAVVTLGAGGAVLLRTEDGRTAQEWLSGYTVAAADTTGAGDAVTATLAAAIAAGTDLRQATALAMRVAAIATTHQGAQPSYPTRADLHSL